MMAAVRPARRSLIPASGALEAATRLLLASAVALAGQAEPHEQIGDEHEESDSNEGHSDAVRRVCFADDEHDEAH